MLCLDYVHLDHFIEMVSPTLVFRSAAAAYCVCHLRGGHDTCTQQVLDIDFASVQLMLNPAVHQAFKNLFFRLSISHLATAYDNCTIIVVHRQ